jgi:hypothetical protein
VALPWLCTVASPYGLALPGYYRRVLDNPTLSHLVTQWQPATVKNSPQFFVILLPALWLAFRQQRALGPFAQLLLVGSALMGLLAIRNVVWFCLVAAAVVPAALEASWRSRPAPRKRGLNLAVLAATAVGLVSTAASLASHGRAWFEQSYPTAAGDAVARAAEDDPGLRVFADARYADWLLFEHPALAGSLAYDVRYELLTARQFQALADFSEQRGVDWARPARGYRLLVLDPSRERKVIAYYARRRAATLYRDDDVAVLNLGA